MRPSWGAGPADSSAFGLKSTVALCFMCIIKSLEKKKSPQMLSFGMSTALFRSSLGRVANDGQCKEAHPYP